MFTNPIKTVRTGVVLGAITAVLFGSPSNKAGARPRLRRMGGRCSK